MPVFAYHALTAGGQGQSGVVDAETARAAWQALRARGIFPTTLEEARERGPRTAPAWARRPPVRELASATRQLATLVGAGVPLADALHAVGEQAAHPGLAHALTVARARLREGAALADALAASPHVFPPLYRDLVRAGETSGALPTVLVRLAEHAEASAALRARLRAALTYPIVMTAATAAVLAFLLAWVVPQVTRLFAETGGTLPLPTRLLVGVTDALRAGWWAIPLVGGAAAWALRAWATTAAGRGRLDAWILRLPVAGRLVQRAALARFARTLATLLAGGVPLETGLGIAGAVVGNRHLATAVDDARDAVRQGRALAPALAATGAFPALFVQLAGVGERGGGLADALARAATTYDGEVEAAVATLTALIEPLLVLVMGAVVLALVTAVLLPLFDLNALVH
jgi:general secretion pathway protein F